MTILTKAANKVPLMYRAQINGRCQVQRLIPKSQEQDSIRWADEWIDKTFPEAPTFGGQVQTKTYQLSWRFVTNGGQDDGVIRPVLGAKGWPYYPGSSMKGIFRRACTPEQANRYCGQNRGRDGMEPGILRFLGGLPHRYWLDRATGRYCPSPAGLASPKRPEIDGGIRADFALQAGDSVWPLQCRSTF